MINELEQANEKIADRNKTRNAINNFRIGFYKT